jgi:hypothetical protein
MATWGGDFAFISVSDIADAVVRRREIARACG